MLIKKIEWVDPFTNETRSKEFYFHLGMGDMSRVELEHGFQGGLEGVAKAIYEARDAEKIIALFEKIIAMSYGRRTDDGDFVKRKEWTQDFVGGRAYDALFYELVTDSEAAAEFINASMPEEVKKKIKELQAQDQKAGNPVPEKPTQEKPVETPTFNLSPVMREPIAKATVDETPAGLTVKTEPVQEPQEDPLRKRLEEYTHVEMTQMPLSQLQELIDTRKGNVPRAVLNLAFQRAMQEK